MCGVCGIVSWTANPPLRSRVLAMRDHLEHRGPDGKGVAEERGGALAATRLAVRGGIEGRQPLRDPSTGILVVCNGEIDNHESLRTWLRSRGYFPPEGSDVAILPDLYLELGEEIASHLEGPFALAIWDPRKEQLLLARDRAGERPLFYLEREKEVLFATELSALAQELGAEPSLDRDALRHYLQFGRFPAPETPFVAVRKVAPAETLLLRRREVRARSYWRWPVGVVPKSSHPSLHAFDRVFREAVRRQTECDVDYGLFLSGGVDSSLVAAVARDLRPRRPLLAFTVRFEEPSYDESAAARAVARDLRLDHVEVPVSAGDLPGTIRELVRLVGEPLADPAWVPTAILAQRAARDVKVVLVGEGGDEVFGGYPTYIGALLSRRYEALPSPVRRAVGTLVERWPPTDRKVTLSFLLKRFVRGEGLSPLARHLLWTSTLSPPLLERLGVAPPESKGAETGLELLDELQRYDLENYLAEGLLTKADRASMGFALEPRAPFLDRGVLEFAASLPGRDRVQGFHTKRFLKRYALRYLPKKVVHQRKKGLSVPLSSWLRGPLSAWSEERFRSGRLAALGIDGEPILGLLEEHRRREHDHGRALWALLVLEEWLEWVEETSSTKAALPRASRIAERVV